MSKKRSIQVAALAASGLLLAACTQAPGAEPTEAPGATTTQSPPAPSPTAITLPDTEDPAQVGVSIVDNTTDLSSGNNVLGPALFDGSLPFEIQGECLGTRMKYELNTAAVDQERQTMLTSFVKCDEGIVTETHSGWDYSGPVQLSVVDANGVTEGWVRITQDPS